MKETPLHIAARVKDGDRCALMLLKSGADPNLATDDGETPVHVAAKHGNLITLQLLLDDGGDPLFTNKVHFSTPPGFGQNHKLALKLMRIRFREEKRRCT